MPKYIPKVLGLDKWIKKHN